MANRKTHPKKETVRLFAVVIVHKGLIEEVALRPSMHGARHFVAKKFHLSSGDKQTVERALEELNTSGKWEVRIIETTL